jgi:hypothetical protein
VRVGNAELHQLMMRLLRPMVQGRTVILTGSAAQSRRMADFFMDAGAGQTASIPIEKPPRETQLRFAAYERALASPDQALVRQLDLHDPDGRALVYAGSFTAVQSVLGRRVIGGRLPGHAAAERKDFQLTITASPGHIADLAGDPRFRDTVVVQGIPDESIAMAASHTYLVPASGDRRKVRDLVATLLGDCSRAVVCPADIGIPCTFYGFLSATWIVDFGPVEALVYWHSSSWRIHAPGVVRPLALSEDVLAAAREAVRSAAMRLNAATGYVGAFGTDGVIHGDQYRIHEINPRVCAGFSLLDEIAPVFSPLAAVDLILREYGSSAAEILLPSLLEASDHIAKDTSPWMRIWEQGRNVQIRKAAPSRNDTDWHAGVREAARIAGTVYLPDLDKELSR